MPEGFLNLLPKIAGHPLAIVAYVCLIVAWLFWIVRSIRSKDFLRALEAIEPADRPKFCRNIGYRYDDIAQLPQRQRLKLLNRRYLLIAYLATLFALVLLIVAMLVVRRDRSAELRTAVDTMKESIASNDKLMFAVGTNPAAAPTIALMKINDRVAVATKRKQEFEEIKTDSFDLDLATKELANKRELQQLQSEQARQNEVSQQAKHESAKQEWDERQRMFREAQIDGQVPFVQYALERLHGLLQDFARQNRIPIRWNCPDARILVSTGGDCEINQGEKSPWTYKISVPEFGKYPSTASVTITCQDRGSVVSAAKSEFSTNGANYTVSLKMALNSMQYMFGSSLDIYSRSGGKLPTLREQLKQGSDYKQGVDSALRSLIAAHAEQLELVSK